MNISFEFNTKQLEKKVLKFNNNLSDKKKFLDDVGNQMITNTQLRIKRERNVRGQRFAKLSPNTIYNINKKTGQIYGFNKRPSGEYYSQSSKILQDEGTLLRSIDYLKRDRDYVIIGTNLKYAARQNSLKNRQFFGLSDIDKKQITEIAETHIKNSKQKAGL